MKLNAQIHIITNSLEVSRHQAEAILILFKGLLSNEKIRHSAALTRSLKLREQTQPISKQISCSHRIYTIRVRVREHKYLLTSQVNGNKLHWGRSD